MKIVRAAAVGGIVTFRSLPGFSRVLSVQSAHYRNRTPLSGAMYNRVNSADFFGVNTLRNPTMKKLRDILLTTVVVLAVGVNLMLFAQADVQVLQSADLHAALALMHPLAPEAVPEFGTFYFVSNCEQTDGSPAPAPFNPRPDAPVYSPGSDDVFLVDDTAPKTLITSRNTSGAAMAGDAPSSDDGTADSGTSTDMLQANYSSPVYGSNDLWLENLPLGTGATQFTVTATDAVGNTSVTNVSVVQNTLVLIIDPLPSDQLNDPTMTVTGTINSTGYTVLVNGVQATVNGNGTWTAQYVPVNGGGTAVVVAQAVPVAGMSASANRESGGTGLLANAQSSPSPQQQTTADKPLTLVMTQYSKDWSFDMTEDDWLWDFESQTVQWNLGQPGNDFWDQCWYTDDPNVHYYSWASDNWDARMYGTGQSGFYRGQDSCGRRDNPSVWQHTISVSLASETCKGGSFRILTDEWDDYYETVNRKVTTRYELRTGAKGTSGRKNLFVLSASAVGLSDLFYPEVDSSSGSYAINPTAIQIGDLGSPWSDGLLCKALGDGETHDATPRVSSARYYTAVSALENTCSHRRCHAPHRGIRTSIE